MEKLGRNENSIGLPGSKHVNWLNFKLNDSAGTWIFLNESWKNLLSLKQQRSIGENPFCDDVNNPLKNTWMDWKEYTIVSWCLVRYEPLIIQSYNVMSHFYIKIKLFLHTEYSYPTKLLNTLEFILKYILFVAQSMCRCCHSCLTTHNTWMDWNTFFIYTLHVLSNPIQNSHNIVFSNSCKF